MVRSLENLPGAGHIQDRLARPAVRVGIQLDEPLVRLQVGLQVGQVHVVVAVRQQRVAKGAKTPGSLRLKWSAKIRSSAARVSGSCS